MCIIFVYRCQLVEWILPLKDDTVETFSGKTTLISNVSLIAEVLVMLTLRDTRLINIPESPQDKPDVFKTIEDMYLKTSFDLPLCDASQVKDRDKSHTDKCSVLSKVHSKLIALLQRDSRQLLEVITDTQVCASVRAIAFKIMGGGGERA